MTDRAIEDWGHLYPYAHVDFRFWIGQILVHCEKIEAKLD